MIIISPVCASMRARACVRVFVYPRAREHFTQMQRSYAELTAICQPEKVCLREL